MIYHRLENPVWVLHGQAFHNKNRTSHTPSTRFFFTGHKYSHTGSYKTDVGTSPLPRPGGESCLRSRFYPIPLPGPARRHGHLPLHRYRRLHQLLYRLRDQYAVLLADQRPICCGRRCHTGTATTSTPRAMPSSWPSRATAGGGCRGRGAAHAGGAPLAGGRRRAGAHGPAHRRAEERRTAMSAWTSTGRRASPTSATAGRCCCRRRRRRWCGMSCRRA